MKFAIYGVSRSGKDYFINELQRYFIKKNQPFYHIKGSETLNRFAQEKYGRNFKLCDDVAKNDLRGDFTKYVNKMEKLHGYVVVDGHYSFYDTDYNLKTVFTLSDLKCYDKFFYLEAEPNDIITRMRESDGDKHNEKLNVDQVEFWQNYEIDAMTDELLSVDKELHIINFCEDAFEYVFKCVTENAYDSKCIAKMLVDNLHIDDNCAVLTDCDHTLSYEDSSTFAFEFIKQPKTVLKRIFANDRYTNFQMWRSYKYSEELKLYTEASVDYALKNITPNQNLIDNLRALNGFCVIGITAGNGKLWSEIVNKFELPIAVLAHDKMLVSKYVKYFVVKELQLRGKYVIAIGDSLLDSLMLKQANKAYIVTAKGHRAYLEKFLSNNATVSQLDYFERCYPFANSEKSVSAIKILPQTETVRNAVEICKSSSESTGRLLRKAHYVLGKKLAAVIRSDFKNDNFAVVSMLRSGVPLSFGIADFFDCPILFYDEHNPEPFLRQLNENPQLHKSAFILCDAVINTGKTVKTLVGKLGDKKCIIATTVLSDKFDCTYNVPIYTARVSPRSYIGAKQFIICGGKGPDTSDRLYNLITK